MREFDRRQRILFLPLVDRKDVTPFGGSSSVVCGCLLVLVWRKKHPKLSPDSLMVECSTSLIFPLSFFSIQTGSPFSVCFAIRKKGFHPSHPPFPPSNARWLSLVLFFFLPFLSSTSDPISFERKAFFIPSLFLRRPLVFCCAFLSCSVLFCLFLCLPFISLPPSLSFLFSFIGLEWKRCNTQHIDRMKKEEDPSGSRQDGWNGEKWCPRHTHTVSSRITLWEKGQRVSLRILSYRTLSGYKNMSFSFLKMKKGKDAWKRKDNKKNKKFSCSSFRYQKRRKTIDCVRWCARVSWHLAKKDVCEEEERVASLPTDWGKREGYSRLDTKTEIPFFSIPQQDDKKVGTSQVNREREREREYEKKIRPSPTWTCYLLCSIILARKRVERVRLPLVCLVLCGMSTTKLSFYHRMREAQWRQSE